VSNLLETLPTDISEGIIPTDGLLVFCFSIIVVFIECCLTYTDLELDNSDFGLSTRSYIPDTVDYRLQLLKSQEPTLELDARPNTLNSR